MGLKGNTLIIVEADNVQFTIIKSWNKMKWDKKTQRLTGIADLELLDKLSAIAKLPPKVAAYRQQLQAVADAVDRERMNPNPTPFYKYPVKLPLYAHQIRASNMCLLTLRVDQAGGGRRIEKGGNPYAGEAHSAYRSGTDCR